MPRPRLSHQQSTPNVNVKVEMPQSDVAPPPKPSEEEKPLFWETLASVTKDQWDQGHQLWIYRLEPKVAMRPGEKGCLAILAEAITPMYIKARWGGGKFRLLLLGKDYKIIAKVEEEISGDPIYEAREQAPQSHANNGTPPSDVVNQFISVLREELQHSRTAGGQNPATEEAISLISRASEKAMDVIAARTGGGVSSTQQLAELITIVKSMMPAQAAGAGFGLKELLELLASPLLANFFKPPNPVEQLSLYLGLFDKLDALRGTGRGGSRDWKALAVEGALQKGPEILRELREMNTVSLQTAQERRAAAEINRATAERMRQPGSGVPAPADAAAQSVAGVPAFDAPSVVSGPLRSVPLDAPAPAAQQVEAMPPAAMPPTFGTKQRDDAIADFVKTRMVQLVKEGAEAEVLIDFLDIADPTVPDMIAQISDEMINSFFEADPILHEAVRDPHWKRILARAREYIREQEQLAEQVPS